LVPTSGEDGVLVRPGTPSDAAAAAGLHASEIAEGFLSRLGPRFLRALYVRITRSDHSFLLVATRNGEIAGFISGSTDLGGLYKQFMLREGIPAAVMNAPKLVMSWRHVLETVRHGEQPATAQGKVCELLSVAVDPRHQDQGIGGRLVGEFLEETARRGVDVAQVVVGKHNLRAVALYERAGFVTSQEFEMHRGITSLLMQQQVESP
jgi:ribosomal protein S18 acetylase RimI-like enzyme